MMYEEVTSESRARRTVTGTARMLLALKMDGPLLIGLALVAVYGLIVLYSSSGQDLGSVWRAAMRLGMGIVAMLRARAGQSRISCAAARRGSTGSAWFCWSWWTSPATSARVRSAGSIWASCASSRPRS